MGSEHTQEEPSDDLTQSPKEQAPSALSMYPDEMVRYAREQGLQLRRIRDPQGNVIWERQEVTQPAHCMPRTEQGGDGAATIDPSEVALMVKILRIYIQKGIIRFREAVLEFRREWGAGAGDLDNLLTEAWDILSERYPQIDAPSSASDILDIESPRPTLGARRRQVAQTQKPLLGQSGLPLASPENTPDYEARKGLDPWAHKAYHRLAARQPKLLAELRRSGLRAWLQEKGDATGDLYLELLLQGVEPFQAEERALAAYLDLEVDPDQDEWEREARKNRRGRSSK